MRRRRCEDRCTEGGQLAAARDEIGVEMRLHHERGPQVEAFRHLEVGCGVPTGINDQRSAIAERHQVGGVSEPLIDKGHDLRAVNLDGKPALEVAGLRPLTRLYPTDVTALPMRSISQAILRR